MHKEGIKNLEIAIFLSALLHIAVLYAIRLNILNMPVSVLKPDKYIELSTIPPSDLKATPHETAKKPAESQIEKIKQQKLVIKNQIVDIPKPLVQQEPKNTAYLSEWSQSVKQEMVSKNKGGGYGTEGRNSLEVSTKPQVPPAGSEKQGQQNQQANEQGLSSYQQNKSSAARESEGQNGKDVKLALNSLLPSYSRMKSIPGIGDNNYLPGLKQGDVTLLNTKSFVYAGFVRRVAYRIFDQFIFDLRNSDITRDDIGNINNYAYVEANMDQSGRLISVRLLKSSGVPSWDQMAVKACKQATWDANPPRGAEGKDGVIHFVFAPGKGILVVGLLD